MVRFGRFDKAETKRAICGLPQNPGAFREGQCVVSVALLAAIIIAPAAYQSEARLFIKAKGMISFADFEVQSRRAAGGRLVFKVFEQNSADATALACGLYSKQQ